MVLENINMNESFEVYEKEIVKIMLDSALFRQAKAIFKDFEKDSSLMTSNEGLLRTISKDAFILKKKRWCE